MKPRKTFLKLVPVGIVLLLFVSPLSAQNSMPNPHDESCWESLSSLHACVLEQYNRAIDQAERCSSYPEYQCMPAPDESASKTEMARGTSKTNSGKTRGDEKAAPVANAVASATAQPVGSK